MAPVNAAPTDAVVHPQPPEVLAARSSGSPGTAACRERRHRRLRGHCERRPQSCSRSADCAAYLPRRRRGRRPGHRSGPVRRALHAPFLWDRTHRLIAELIVSAKRRDHRRQGVAGLYTSTLFSFDPSFFDRLGRRWSSAVRSSAGIPEELHAAPAALEGIGRYVVHNRGTRTSSGRSASRTTTPALPQLMTASSRRAGRGPTLPGSCGPRTLPHQEGRTARPGDTAAALTDEERYRTSWRTSSGTARAASPSQTIPEARGTSRFNVDRLRERPGRLIIVDLLRTERKYLTGTWKGRRSILPRAANCDGPGCGVTAVHGAGRGAKRSKQRPPSRCSGEDSRSCS